MQAPSGQTAAPAVQALLMDGALAGEWVLDRRKSSIRFKSRSMFGLVPVNGVFREVSGSGTLTCCGSSVQRLRFPSSRPIAARIRALLELAES